MKMTITGINFNYDEGFDQQFTSVALSFITSGASYSINGPITVTKDEYQASSANNDELKTLIKGKIIEDLQA